MRKTSRHRVLTALTLPLFLVFSTVLVAQEATDSGGRQPLFTSHDIMTVRIEAPLTTLMKERPEEEYLDGTFHYVDTGGQEHSFDLKLRTRGRYRRKKSTCNFPPVRLNFRKKQVAESEFAGQDKLKLVTHCQTRKKSFEQLVLREYLAYRIMHTLTDDSFGARLMRITYVDTDKAGDSAIKYGFVIEDEDDIGSRIGKTGATIRGIKSAELEPQQANLVSVFEYLIGNTDFSLILGPADTSCCHNAILYSASVDVPPYTPIPYDFDFSGIVDAPYAEPNPRFNIRSVKTRIYRGRCMNNELLDDTFAYFLEKEPEIRKLVDDLEDLDDRNRKEVTKYMDDFFEDIVNPKTKQRRFIGKCS